MRHVCTLLQTLGLAREMCEKAKTIGDPENQDILNRLCELLERRLAKKKEKDTGGTGKRNAGLVRVILIRARTHDTRTRVTHVPTRSTTLTLTDHTFGPLSLLGHVVTQEEQHLWQEVDSMKADHLKPDKYMKNKKDFMFEELKVRAQPLPYVWNLCGHMLGGESHLNGPFISTGESYLAWGLLLSLGAHGEISTQADCIWICGYSILCEISSREICGRSPIGRMLLKLHWGILQSRRCSPIGAGMHRHLR